MFVYYTYFKLLLGGIIKFGRYGLRYIVLEICIIDTLSGRVVVTTKLTI